MIDLKNIRSLSDFQRNTKKHIERLTRTGSAEILTVNGQAALVVQSAEGYQKLLEAADMAESIHILKKRLAAADNGEEGIPAEDVLAAIRKKMGIKETG